MTQKSERRIIAGDYKRIYLDLPEFNLLAPIEGIYDEPTVYYKANIRWAKLIEGFLAHLAEITAWKDAEDENYHGTQQILTFLERVEVPFIFPEESGCNNFLPSAAFVSYYPQDPYNSPDYIPDDYLVPPFFVNDELEYPEALGYKATDVFISPSAINIDPIDLVTLNLPRIEITVKGSGQLEIDFLAVQQGSSAILKIGSMPNIIDIITGGIIEEGVTIIDLNNDSISIPPEKDIVQSEEVNIEAEPDELTTVYIVFMPVIDDSFIPLALGGGIRQIGLCAFEDMEEGGSVEAVRFNQDNCSFEQRISGEWEVIEGNEYIAACLGGGMSVEEICEGVICAMEQAASRFLSGVAGNVEGGVTINPDGTIEIGNAGGGLDDDPETEINEAEASIMGATISLGKGIELFLDKIDAYYGAVNGTPVTTEADAQTALKIYFPCDGVSMDLAVAAYYTYRTTNPRIIFDATAAFNSYMYCRGANLRTFLRWMGDLSGWSTFKQSIVNGLMISLLPEFFETYYQVGLSVPSTTYLDASCVPVDDQTLSAMVLGTTRNTTALKASHRMLLIIDGYALDADGDIQDFFWYRTAAGVLTFHGLMGIANGGFFTYPTQFQVPYKSSHHYEVTIDNNSINFLWGITLSKHASINATGLTYPTPLSITLKDLGEFTV